MPDDEDDEYESFEGLGTGPPDGWMTPRSEVDLFVRDMLAEERARQAERRVRDRQERDRNIAEGTKAAQRLWDQVQALLRLR